jgi:hypothetical protein
VEKKLITAKSSIEFRDAVFNLRKNGSQKIYAQASGSVGQVYVIIDGIRHFTVQDLFSSNCPPVQMEDFAQALVDAARQGAEVPEIDVFMFV